MSLELVTMWRCDLCALVAHEGSDGWGNAIYAHGCPDHAGHILAHKADVMSDTRGRGRSEKTTWFLRCACGWLPPSRWSTWNYGPLVDQHRVHLRETQPAEEPTREH